LVFVSCSYDDFWLVRPFSGLIGLTGPPGCNRECTNGDAFLYLEIILQRRYWYQQKAPKEDYLRLESQSDISQIHQDIRVLVDDQTLFQGLRTIYKSYDKSETTIRISASFYIRFRIPRHSRSGNVNCELWLYQGLSKAKMKVIARYREKITCKIMIGNDAGHLVDTPCVVCFAKVAIFIELLEVEVG